MLKVLIEILTFVGLYCPSLVYAVKKFITWRVYGGSGGNDEEKKIAKEARLKCICGFVVFGLTNIFLLFLIFIVIPKFEPVLIQGKGASVIEVNPKTNVIYVKDLPIGGDSYSGYYNTEKEKPEGKGIMKYINGDVYDGDWENGVRQGDGIMKYYTGDVYDGEWVNGEKCGEGIFTWKDGRKYDGHYKDDMRDGQGTYSGWTGFEEKYGYGWKGTYVGVNKDDKFEGQGNFYFDNGGEFEGIFFDNGLWSGKYKKDGNTYNVVDGEILF